jgi:hypothetical protein
MPYRDHETRLRDLRMLCARADQLRAAADELCRSLEDQLTRQIDGPSPLEPPKRRARKPHRHVARSKRR